MDTEHEKKSEEQEDEQPSVGTDPAGKPPSKKNRERSVTPDPDKVGDAVKKDTSIKEEEEDERAKEE